MFFKLIDIYEWDFCQIQYNYLDETNQAGRAGLELAGAKGMPVIIMEPLRGGQLVNQLPQEIRRLFKEHAPGRSAATWSLRWIWNHPEVTVLLSGMNEMSQLDDNIQTAEQMLPGSIQPEEMAVYDKVKKIMFITKNMRKIKQRRKLS